MTRQKLLIILIFTIFTPPLLLSALSWIGTLIQVAAIGMVNWKNPAEALTTIVALITMLLAGTYMFTYGFTLMKTLDRKKVCWYSFLPVLHIAWFILFIFLWFLLNRLYPV